MKHFMDIVRVKENSEDGMVAANTGAFKVGDHIQISEKWDGANASIAWEDGELKAFSRKNELNMNNNLRGFWEFVQTLDKDKFRDLGNRVLFGEATLKHTVKYNQDAYDKKWIVYDMFDKDTEQWLPQTVVKEFAESHGLEYIHVLYDGPFISWEHCKTFLNSPAYGDKQEGIIIKNQDKLNDPDCRNPFYLKIVNDSFKEIQLNNHIKKVLDPNDEIDKAKAEECAAKVVTEARIRKDINKMIDEGILPETINPQDMGIVARNLPKRIYDDVIKEESELIGDCISNKYFGKAVGSQVMNWAKKIILGV